MTARIPTLAMALAATLVLACGDDPVKPPEYADLSGSLEGTAEGNGPAMTFTGTSSLTVTQTDGTIKGTGSLQGEITFGGQKVPMNLPNLPFTGTVAKGENPAVTLAFPDGCNGTNDFSGTYTEATKELSLTGTVAMFDDQCEKVADLNTTLKLKK